MAVAAVLAGLQANINCPVCLDDLRDPVTIECGHNFCRSCIQRSWADLRDRFPCPVCRHPCQDRHPRSNVQLGRMVDIARLLQVTGSQERREDRRLCEKHNGVLSLFCEEDLEVLCPLCAQAPDHQGHQVRPTEEAASHHRRKLRGYLEALRVQVADFLELEAAQDRSQRGLSAQLRRRRRELASGYDHLMRSVEHAQEVALSRLAEEEKDIQLKLSANIVAFSQHICTLRGLLTEVAERSVMADVPLLAGLRSVVGRCEGLKSPAVYRVQVRREGCRLPPQYAALQKIIQTFREEVTLDAETAHPHLLVSEDKQSVAFVRRKRRPRRNPQGFMADAAVLGAERFDRGRHYWEVQVGDKPEWAVGVCGDPPCRKRKRPGAGQDRLWTIQLQDGDYVARGPAPVPLVLKEKPRGIGVYLDYELGQISFYSLNDRSHIHSFLDRFSEALKPYFCPGRDPEPLTVCAARDDEG